MTDAQLAVIEARVGAATSGPWGPYTANNGVYVSVLKPAPSLATNDATKPTFWRYEDGIFVMNAVIDMRALIAEIRLLKNALRQSGGLDGI